MWPLALARRRHALPRIDVDTLTRKHRGTSSHTFKTHGVERRPPPPMNAFALFGSHILRACLSESLQAEGDSKARKWDVKCSCSLPGMSICVYSLVGWTIYQTKVEFTRLSTHSICPVCGPLLGTIRITHPFPLLSFNLKKKKHPPHPILSAFQHINIFLPWFPPSPSSFICIQSIFSPAWWLLDEVSFWLETVMKTEILFPGWPLWVFSTTHFCCRVIDVVVLVSQFALIDVSACF